MFVIAMSAFHARYGKMIAHFSMQRGKQVFIVKHIHVMRGSWQVTKKKSTLHT